MRRLAVSIMVASIVVHCSLVTDFDGVADGTDAGSDTSAGATGGAAGGGSGGLGGSGAAAGGGGADAEPDAHDAASDATCDAPTVGGDYELKQLPAGTVVTIDGFCDEVFWAKLPTFPFTGANFTDNGISCRLAWADGAPPVQYGCCNVTDDDLRATVVMPDGDVFDDDSIEVILKGNAAQTIDATTTKLFFNLLETVKDMRGPLPWDGTYDAQVQVKRQHDGTLNAIGADVGYVLEWRADLGFEVTAPQLGLCQMMLNDRDLGDGGPVETTWTAFGQEVNNPSHWGVCTFSCGAP